MDINSIKKAMLCLVVSVMAFGAFAEDTTGKQHVFIDYFSRPSNLSFSWAEALRNNFINGILDCSRVELTDVDTNSSLAIEKSRRESGNVTAGDDMERLKVMTIEGANALIQGSVTNISVAEKKYDKGKKYYTAVCSYTVKLVDPATGKELSSKTFKHGDGLLDVRTSDTAEEAAMKVCQDAQRDARFFIEEAFPVRASILEVNETKGDEVKTVYISVGSDQGISEDGEFAVCVQRTIAGRESEKPIGMAKIKTIEGGDISLAEIKKGGKEIKAALDAGQTIVLKSIPKKPKKSVQL